MIYRDERRKKYVPLIDTAALWPMVGMRVGGNRHDKLIDELANVQGPVDEERLLAYYQSGESYEDAGRMVGLDATGMAHWYRQFKKRANRCPRLGCCGR